eukprot:288517_1
MPPFERDDTADCKICARDRVTGVCEERARDRGVHGPMWGGGGGDGDRLSRGTITKSHVAQLLLTIANNFAFGRPGERIAALRQNLHQIVDKIAVDQIQSEDSVKNVLNVSSMI